MKRAILSLLLILLSAVPVFGESLGAGPYTLEVETVPTPPVVGDNTLKVTVLFEGKPASEVTVEVEYDMVGMSMDMKPPDLTSESPGHFSGNLMLSMPGLWKLAFKVSGPGGKGEGELTLKTGEAKAAPSTNEKGDLEVSLQTEPSPPEVGDVPVRIEVKDKEGQPVDGAMVMVGADMPGMSMGLRPQSAASRGKGIYETTVPLSMEGLWKLTVEVNGKEFTFQVVAGGGSGGGPPLFWIVGGLLILGVAVALARGWRPPAWQVGVLLLLGLGVWALSRYADTRRPADKTMGMKMDMAEPDMGMNISEMQAPVPVALKESERGTVDMTVTYTGTVKPFLEETLYPRVEGYLLELPLYPGDRVSAGQVVGRLDSEELGLAQEKARAQAQAAASQAREAAAQTAAVESGIDVAGAQLEEAEKLVERAKAEIHKTDVDLDYWKGVLRRERELYDAEAVSLEELEEKETRFATAKVMHHHATVDLERAQAEVRTRRAALAQARKKTTAAQAAEVSSADRAQAARLEAAEKSVVTDYTTLRSRISGVVTERMIDPGVLVRPGMGLLKIAQLRQVRLQFTVAEEDLVYIHEGTPITVTSQALYRPFEAEVTSMFHAVDPRSRTGIVEAVVDNPDGDRLLPGTFVVGEFALRSERRVIWVPREAVLSHYDEPFVWLAQERAGKLVAARRKVETGARSDERVEISDGLATGDQVIVAGFQDLVEGTPVTPGRYGEGIYQNLILPDPEATP